MNNKIDYKDIIDVWYEYSTLQFDDIYFSLFDSNSINKRRKFIDCFDGENKKYKTICQKNFPDDTKNLLYFFLGKAYNDEAKMLLIKHNFINKGDDEYLKLKWNCDKFQNVKNKYITSIINKVISFNERALFFLKKIDCGCESRDLTAEKNNSISIIYSDLAKIYYFSDQFEKFLNYADEAVSYGSVSAVALLVQYYLDCDSVKDAIYYFIKVLNIKIYNKDDDLNIILKEHYKFLSGQLLVNYFFNIGEYTFCKEIFDIMKEIVSKSLYLKDGEYLEFIDKQEKLLADKTTGNFNKILDEELLKKYYAVDVISRMDENVKTFIISSIKVYDFINDSDMCMDYSPALISVFKAVEYLLYKIIIENYFVYLRGLDLSDYSFLNKKFTVIDDVSGKRIISDHIVSIEYGDAQFLVGKRELENEGWVIAVYFKDFFELNKKLSDSDILLQEFISRLNSLREKRNQVAHRHRIYKNDAETCIKELIEDHIDFISFIYINFNFIF